MTLMSSKEELFYLCGFLGVRGKGKGSIESSDAWVTLPDPLGANKAQGGLPVSGWGAGWKEASLEVLGVGRKHDLIHLFICKPLL